MMNGRRWTDPELAMLERLAGEIPFPELVAMMHVLAARQAKAGRVPA